MSTTGDTKLTSELRIIERELRDRLLGALPDAEDRNSVFFFTSEHNPHALPKHVLSQESEQILELAKRTLEIRRLLNLPTNDSPGQLFLDACAEASDVSNPERLGPRRLASKLRRKLETQSD